MRSFQQRQQFVSAVYNDNASLFAATAEAASNAELLALEAWEPYINEEIHLYLYPLACAHIGKMNPEALVQIGPLFAAELKKAADDEAPGDKSARKILIR